MLIAAMVCMLVAVLALCVGICFVKRNKWLHTFLFALSLIALLCLAVSCGAYKNNFSGFTVVLIVSILPMFLLIIKPFQKATKNAGENISEFGSETEQKLYIDEKAAKKDENNTKFAHFLEIFSPFIKIAAYFASALAIAFCGLYIGKESGWAFALGLCIGLALTFLDMIITKEFKDKNIKEKLLLYAQRFLLFASVGLLFASMLTALVYSFCAPNILFAIGAIAYAVNILLEKYYKNNFNHLAYFIGMLLMIAAILF